MRTRECTGRLIVSDQKSIDATLVNIVRRPTDWFKARGTLYLEQIVLDNSSNTKWHVGVFQCKKPDHQGDNDIFSLNAADTGEIIKLKQDSIEKRKLQVEVTRMSFEKQDVLDRPKVRRIKD